MATINARLLADDLVRELKLHAARNNRSLESEVRHILGEAVKDAAKTDPSAKRAAFLARTAELRSASEGRPQTPAELLIRADRDQGH